MCTFCESLWNHYVRMFATVLYKNHIFICGRRCVKGTLWAEVACLKKKCAQISHISCKGREGSYECMLCPLSCALGPFWHVTQVCMHRMATTTTQIAHLHSQQLTSQHRMNYRLPLIWSLGLLSGAAQSASEAFLFVCGRQKTVLWTLVDLWTPRAALLQCLIEQQHCNEGLLSEAKLSL